MLHEKSLGSVKIQSVDYNALLETIKGNACTIKAQYPLVTNVFLFGSFYKGNYTPESDIDILIIVKKTEVSFLQRRDVFINFFHNIPFDVNILVYTQREIKKMEKEGNPFITSIMNNSIDLLNKNPSR